MLVAAKPYYNPMPACAQDIVSSITNKRQHFNECFAYEASHGAKAVSRSRTQPSALLLKRCAQASLPRMHACPYASPRHASPMQAPTRTHTAAPLDPIHPCMHGWDHVTRSGHMVTHCGQDHASIGPGPSCSGLWLYLFWPQWRDVTHAARAPPCLLAWGGWVQARVQGVPPLPAVAERGGGGVRAGGSGGRAATPHHHHHAGVCPCACLPARRSSSQDCAVLHMPSGHIMRCRCRIGPCAVI